MNELIKRLAEQCEEHPYALHTIDLEKFAELIVKECVNICRDSGRWFQEQDDRVEAGAAYALAYEIKQHFGVSE